jgi:hypothetical protein
LEVGPAGSTETGSNRRDRVTDFVAWKAEVSGDRFVVHLVGHQSEYSELDGCEMETEGDAAAQLSDCIPAITPAHAVVIDEEGCAQQGTDASVRTRVTS